MHHLKFAVFIAIAAFTGCSPKMQSQLTREIQVFEENAFGNTSGFSHTIETLTEETAEEFIKRETGVDVDLKSLFGNFDDVRVTKKTVVTAGQPATLSKK